MLKFRKIIAVFMLLALLVPFAAMPAAAAGTTTLNVKATYYDASGMLDGINAFRTATDGSAWQWDKDDASRTVFNVDAPESPIIVGDKEVPQKAGGTLGTLQYDYKLEEYAMQRAAEIATFFSHTRPDGTFCTSIFTTHGSAKGENIAFGYGSAASVLEAWKETNELYIGQGHRRNMLNPAFTSVGIAHAVVDGGHCWVQVFGSPHYGGTANSFGTQIRTVTTDSSNLALISAETTEDSITVEVGDSKAVPQYVYKYQLKFYYDEYNKSDEGDTICSYTTPAWTVADDTIAVIEGGKVVGKKPGKTSLVVNVGTSGGGTAAIMPLLRFRGIMATADASGNIVIPVTVTAHDITQATVTLDASEYAHTGSAIEPVPTVTMGGETLVKDTDYTVTYEDNTYAGTGKVIITGIGSYAGEQVKEFTITGCADDAHTPEAREATCDKPQRCTVCGMITAEKAHTPGDAATCGAPQKCTVCDTVLVKPTGNHTPGDAADCIHPQLCKVCNQEVTPATGIHTPGAEATCKDPQKCTICDAVIKAKTNKHADKNNDGKCDVCGVGVKPSTGDKQPEGAKTSDNIVLFTAILAAFILSSAVVMAIIWFKKKQQAPADTGYILKDASADYWKPQD